MTEHTSIGLVRDVAIGITFWTNYRNRECGSVFRPKILCPKRKRLVALKTLNTRRKKNFFGDIECSMYPLTQQVGGMEYLNIYK